MPTLRRSTSLPLVRPSERAIITFVSDFRYDDWFVGVVHGVIHALAPEAHVVDLTHSVPPGDVARGAFVLEAAAQDFPPGTVHLAVVDPGVGTKRRALAVSSRRHFFVGPDNGLLEWALCDPDAVTHSLTEAKFFRAPLSRTFHGRDVFAPIAAALARGEKLKALGPVVADAARLPAHAPELRDGTLIGRVVFIDRFGNALTNLTADAIASSFAERLDDAQVEVRVLDRRIVGLARSYGDAPVGTLVAIIGSSGRLEIAQVGGAAAGRIGIGEGDQVAVRRRG